jgi:hypothetical protein
VAGDWLKMTHALPEKPEVLAIAGKTGLTRFDVVGRLFIMWRWFDTNTTDGNAAGVTSVTLNECLFGYQTSVPFVSAVRDAGWLTESDGGVGVVKFDEHISESAKTRAQTAKRVAKSKNKGKANGDGNGESVTSSVTETVPREEKRREERNTGDDALTPGFQRFWETWPASDRKAARGKCFASWKKAKADPLADSIVADVERLKRSASWSKDNGQFIPAPLVYLNERRWEGADATDSDPYGLKGAI